MNVLRDAGRAGLERTGGTLSEETAGAASKGRWHLRQVSNDGRILM